MSGPDPEKRGNTWETDNTKMKLIGRVFDALAAASETPPAFGTETRQL
jgi:hypothetical protein